jgi:hypothetical protein
MVARERTTLPHHVVGWKRSRGIRQPPDITIAMVEVAMAFMWKTGSGVSILSQPGCSAHRPPMPGYQLPQRRNQVCETTQPFGRAVVPEV